ncbi:MULTISPECIES: MalY/PatB family protein [unclassified Carboxylicivirga]|uniref:MalY/PatB family protein n=1 Tax=Carboxylicivirga TaxID=1628153 RepID=UPI003D32C38F
MTYDFDTPIDRSGTDAYKLELRQQYFGNKEVIPLWVADMDFAVPPEVQADILERASHEIYGYTIRQNAFSDAIVNWCRQVHDWEVAPQWIEYSPGVVPALTFSLLSLTQEGDGVIINTPVYPPFYSIIGDNKRQVVKNPLRNVDGRYEIDFALLEEQAARPEVKLYILCSPHNPVGRVWTREELQRIADICHQHKVLVLADEIHADLALFGHRHIPYASISDVAALHSLSFMAPSKTFNIAGFSTSYVISKNEALLSAYQSMQNRLHLQMGHVFSGLALTSAYTKGHAWLTALKNYLEENIMFIEEYLGLYLPELSFYRPEATYLLWIDFSSWGMSQRDLRDFLVNKAQVGLNDGLSFGREGKGYMRLNVASPRATLQQALQQIREARMK